LHEDLQDSAIHQVESRVGRNVDAAPIEHEPFVELRDPCDAHVLDHVVDFVRLDARLRIVQVEFRGIRS
jgi:hypothetical protein